MFSIHQIFFILSALCMGAALWDSFPGYVDYGFLEVGVKFILKPFQWVDWALEATPLGVYILLSSFVLRSSPPFRRTLLSVFHVSSHLTKFVLTYFRDTTVSALREQTKGFINPKYLHEVLAAHDDEVDHHKRSIRQLTKERDDAKSFVDTLEARIRSLIVQYNVEEVKATQDDLKMQINNLASELGSVKEQLKDAKATIQQKDRVISDLQDANKEVKAKLRTKADQVNNLDVEVACLQDEASKRRHDLFMREKRASLFGTVLEILFRLSEVAGDGLTAAVLFAKHLQNEGVILPELGIDATRLDILWDFVKAGQSTSHPIQPQLGFRLTGSFYPISGTQLVGTTVHLGRQTPFAPMYPPVPERSSMAQQPPLVVQSVPETDYIPSHQGQSQPIMAPQAQQPIIPVVHAAPAVVPDLPALPVPRREPPAQRRQRASRRSAAPVAPAAPTPAAPATKSAASNSNEAPKTEEAPFKKPVQNMATAMTFSAGKKPGSFGVSKKK